jgi:hypothetical protein
MFSYRIFRTALLVTQNKEHAFPHCKHRSTPSQASWCHQALLFRSPRGMPPPPLYPPPPPPSLQPPFFCFLSRRAHSPGPSGFGLRLWRTRAFDQWYPPSPPLPPLATPIIPLPCLPHPLSSFRGLCFLSAHPSELSIPPRKQAPSWKSTTPSTTTRM